MLQGGRQEIRPRDETQATSPETIRHLTDSERSSDIYKELSDYAYIDSNPAQFDLVACRRVTTAAFANYRPDSLVDHVICEASAPSRQMMTQRQPLITYHGTRFALGQKTSTEWTPPRSCLTPTPYTSAINADDTAERLF